jgi:hypothetical protein
LTGAHTTSSFDSFGRPQLTEGALYGLPGDVVRAILPHTEACDAALLMSYLTCLGNCFGPQPSLLVGADWHPGRLFVLVIGDSARGRKGTAGSEITRVMSLADPVWHRDRVEHGLQSAEALIARCDKGETRDPRLLVVEFEFGRMLVVMRARPNLANTLKLSWDGGDLSVATKDRKRRLRAEGAHVSLIGHITAAELGDRLTATDIDSGFAGRFLYVVSYRSKLLPSGGRLDLGELGKLADPTAETVRFARDLGLSRLDPVSRVLAAHRGVYPPVELDRTRGFRRRWESLYVTDFEEPVPGVTAGAVTCRVAPQVLRLSVIYALADLSGTVDTPHLEAAWAAWRYTRDSAISVFGTVTGNRDADRIMRELRRARRLRKKDIWLLFSRNRSQRQLDEAIVAVLATGQVRESSVVTGGRPAQVFEWIQEGEQ